MLLPVTLTTAAACGLISLWLAFRAVRQRFASKAMTGDNGDPTMIARMRAHANFAEYAPIVLVLIALVELARGPGTLLWAVAAIFVIGRVLHPLGMERKPPNPFRAGGIATTWLALLVLAIWALAIAWSAHASAASVRGEPVEMGAPTA